MGFSEQIKVSVRRKAKGRCCICQEPFVDIHHIFPQAEGGLDTEDNAAPLCPSCHRKYGNNPDLRKAITEYRDIWFEECATQPLLVQFIIQQTEDAPKLQTFDDLERYVLDLSVVTPMAAFLQLYEAMEQQLMLVGGAIGMERTEVWNLDVGTKLLKERLQEPHIIVAKLLSILKNYAELYRKTIMPEDDEPITDQDILSTIALGLKLPRLIRDTLRYIPIDEDQPKIWPVLERPLEP